MISQSERQLVDNNYFNIIHDSPFCMTFQSKCTLQYWHVIRQEYGKVKRYLILHRHGDTGAYHEHGHAAKMAEVIQQIKAHDRYQLNGRK